MNVISCKDCKDFWKKSSDDFVKIIGNNSGEIRATFSELHLKRLPRKKKSWKVLEKKLERNSGTNIGLFE